MQDARCKKQDTKWNKVDMHSLSKQDVRWNMQDTIELTYTPLPCRIQGAKKTIVKHMSWSCLKDNYKRS